jgi:hypothetical protein
MVSYEVSTRTTNHWRMNRGRKPTRLAASSSVEGPLSEVTGEQRDRCLHGQPPAPQSMAKVSR